MYIFGGHTPATFFKQAFTVVVEDTATGKWSAHPEPRIKGTVPLPRVGAATAICDTPQGKQLYMFGALCLALPCAPVYLTLGTERSSHSPIPWLLTGGTKPVDGGMASLVNTSMAYNDTFRFDVQSNVHTVQPRR